MPIYSGGAGSNIGTLLRLIQEEKSSNLAALPPAADPNSPIRGTIQQPIKTPESPGSDRVVSLRPEGVIQSGPAAAPVVAPVAPVAPVPTPVPTPTAPRASAPSATSSNSSPAPRPATSFPSIATSIKASVPQQVLGTRAPQKASSILDYNRQFFMPKPSSVGGRVVNSPLAPTPTPAPSKKKPTPINYRGYTA